MPLLAVLCFALHFHMSVGWSVLGLILISRKQDRVMPLLNYLLKFFHKMLCSGVILFNSLDLDDLYGFEYIALCLHNSLCVNVMISSDTCSQ